MCLCVGCNCRLHRLQPCVTRHRETYQYVCTATQARLALHARVAVGGRRAYSLQVRVSSAVRAAPVRKHMPTWRQCDTAVRREGAAQHGTLRLRQVARPCSTLRRPRCWCCAAAVLNCRVVRSQYAAVQSAQPILAGLSSDLRHGCELTRVRVVRLCEFILLR